MLHYRKPMKLIRKRIDTVQPGEKVVTSRGVREVVKVEKHTNGVYCRIDLSFQFGLLSGLCDAEVEIEVSDV